MEPELSVVIATRNRRELLLRCLESLAAQTVDPARFEVIVADDGSEDGTAAAVESHAAKFSLRCLRLERGGQAAAQNQAVEASLGSVVLFLDDDVIAGGDLVRAHIAAHSEDPCIVGVGRLEQAPPRRRDWYARMFARSWNRHYSELAEGSVAWSACFGGNLSAPRSALLQLGGFASDLRTGVDVELAYRLQRHGLTPRFLPQAQGVHDDQKPWRRLLDDSRRQGARVELIERHPEMITALYGWFGATSKRELALRRAALVLRLSPRALVHAGRLLPGDGRKEIWFHFVSRLTFWRAAKAALDRDRWEQLTRGVPVLMYHAFSATNEGDRYVVSRRALSRQLRMLRLFGYRSVDFAAVAQCLDRGELPPPRAVAITIDDGYLDNLEVADSVLRQHGFSATIFLVSGKLGAVNDWTPTGADALSGRPLMSPAQARELRDRGIAIGAHTRSHPVLPEQSDEEVREQIGGSRRDLEEVLDAEVPTFAYPFGLFDERAVAAVSEAGFVGACTVEPRLVFPHDTPLRVPRIEVRAGESLLRFLLNIRLGAA